MWYIEKEYSSWRLQLVSVFVCKTWCTMDIYYCKKCGKRIANQDIQDQKRSNQALDGMYCKQCIAVLSQSKADKSPVSEKKSAQLQAIATKARSSPPSGEFRMGAGHGVIRRRIGPATAVKDNAKPAPDVKPRTRYKLFWVAAAGGAALGLAVIVVLRFSGGSSAVTEIPPKSLLPLKLRTGRRL